MRILYVDIDSLRPDHLGCYGYHRATSPTIDVVAARGTRCDHYYTTDAPCLPSRTALFTGRYGIQNGVIGHGGTAADPFIQGPGRGFRSALGQNAWMTALRRAGYRTATVSTFGERHSAFHWYAGFQDVYNHGTGGGERADEVLPYVLRWLDQWARHDKWFLHVNFWDPHTPYRTPVEYGDPFAQEPPPAWLTAEILDAQRASYGPHSAREPGGFGAERPGQRLPRLVDEIRTLDDWKRWIDGYDTGIRYMDDHFGRIMQALADHGVLDDTLVIISADHGENQGELNVYGDHQTADFVTCRVPLVVAGPGIRQGAVDHGLHYHLDLAPTVCALAGAPVGAAWSGSSFADGLQEGKGAGRPYLVISQGAWACQRSVRFGPWLLVRTYDPGLKAFPPLMLFNVETDPHETRNLADDEPQVVQQGLAMLEDWVSTQMRLSASGVDPMWTVLREGGPFHTRGMLERYCERLRATGRGHHADRLIATGGRGW
jgi:arylsulfatase A-like enzyme